VAVKTYAYAPYGELTFKIADNLNLIGGLRYSYEKKHLVNASNGALRRDESAHWDNLDYRLTAQYYVNPNLNVYATSSTGFKSGTYNAASFTNPPVRPETVDALEVGVKYGHNGITFDADAFHYIQKDIQVQKAFDPVLGGAFLQNAARAKLQGVEASLRVPLGELVVLNVGGTLMKGKYTDYKNADVTTPIVGGGNTSINLDVTGRPTYRTPERTVNAGLTYRQDAFGGILTAAGSIYYSSRFSWEASDRLREPAHTLLNARASWSPQNERFTVSVWGENLGDEFYYVNAVASTSGDSGNMGAPRRFGVTISTHLF
jgi:iron complex outermembrane receptor protein